MTFCRKASSLKVRHFKIKRAFGTVCSTRDHASNTPVLNLAVLLKQPKVMKPLRA